MRLTQLSRRITGQVALVTGAARARVEQVVRELVAHFGRHGGVTVQNT